MTERKIALSIEEAADYTGIGRNTLRKLVEWKKLPLLDDSPRLDRQVCQFVSSSHVSVSTDTRCSRCLFN